MYDFSGLVCTALATLSYAIFDLFLLVAEKIVKKEKFKLKSRENITILFAAMALVVLSLLYLSRICWPNVSMYTGEYTYGHRSREVPGLIISYEYFFCNDEGKENGFHLSTVLKERILGGDLKVGQKYTVYYYNWSKIIVKIEAIE